MHQEPIQDPWSGALLVHKPDGMTSFGVIEELRKAFPKKEAPKFGHGGTLDPFATGLLVILVGQASKLARHFLGSRKTYRGVIRFGATTVPGDPTEPETETTTVLPETIDGLNQSARLWTQQAYLQVPPMHSAKKVNGKPLYLLARAGIEIDRDPKTCHLYQFRFDEYSKPDARFFLECSSGTYVRTLAQDFGRFLGSLGYVRELSRVGSGSFSLDRALPLAQILSRLQEGVPMSQLSCSVPFDGLMAGLPHTELSTQELGALLHGRYGAIQRVAHRISWGQADYAALFYRERLRGVVRLDTDGEQTLRVENVFRFGSP